ncbi:MAG TPA: TAXI family TRAP transporter solute-binding subunit, partial [Thermoguttaceae bacterium]|nr:TAXI family TRAP transporter solute-binding subunit [Thermoguttaceae bacterium]
NKHVGRPVTVLKTSGSLANRRLLIDGQAEVGLLQSGSAPLDELAVVTPLYYEVVFVVARRGQGIDDIADLGGKAVSLGPEDSGMRRSALRIIQHYEIDPQSLSESTAPFTSLLADETMQAAIITTGLQNDDLQTLLGDERFTLLPIDDRDAEELSRKNHCFKPTHIDPADVPGHLDIGDEGIRSVMTPAFLAVHVDATGLLVRTLLETIYLESDMVGRYGLMSREEAAEWQDRALHPAAREFFHEASVLDGKNGAR